MIERKICLDEVVVTPGTGWEDDAVFGSADAVLDIVMVEGGPEVEKVTLANVRYKSHWEDVVVPTGSLAEQWLAKLDHAARNCRTTEAVLQAVHDDYADCEAYYSHCEV